MELKVGGAQQAKYNMWLALGSLLIAGILWRRPEIGGSGLLYHVDPLLKIETFETHFYYTFVLGITFIPVFIFSFLPRIRFYRYWKSVFTALVLVAIPFLIWDVYFTEIGVWGFNEAYHEDVVWFGLPVEEILFFFAIPFACIFLYEAIEAYFGGDPLESLDTVITAVLVVSFLLLAILYRERLYTATTFGLATLFTWFHYVTFENTFRTKWYRAFFVSLIPFVLINGMLTGLFTEQPVVVYNMSENLGLRLWTIPLDDFGYSYLLLFTTFTLYELLRSRWF